MHHSTSQMKHQLDATLCRFNFCRVTLHVSGASAHHQEYLKLVRRPLVHVLSLQVSHHISLLWPEHAEWLCRNKTCTVLHQVGVSFDSPVMLVGGTDSLTVIKQGHAAGGAVGWGTALKAGRLRVRFPMVSLELFTDIILPAAPWCWGRLSL